MTVTVASAVVAEAGPDKTIASGGSTTLEGSASGGVAPYTYSWSPTTGLSNPNIAQPTASPTTTTTYTLTVHDSLAQTATDTVTVTVASAVVADAGPDKTIASGGSTTLEGSASGGVGPYTYSWSPTTGLSNPNIAQPTASPTTTTTYTLTVHDSLAQTATDTRHGDGGLGGGGRSGAGQDHRLGRLDAPWRARPRAAWRPTPTPGRRRPG